MIRQIALRAAVRSSAVNAVPASTRAVADTVRSYRASVVAPVATKAQKRALNRQQLGAAASGLNKSPSGTTPLPGVAGAAAAQGTAAGGGSDGRGGAPLLFFGIAALAAGGAAAYYTNSIPPDLLDKLGLSPPSSSSDKTTSQSDVKAVQLKQDTTDDNLLKGQVVDDKNTTDVTEAEERIAKDVANKVSAIRTFGGKASNANATVAVVVAHPEGGNRVIMTPLSKPASAPPDEPADQHKPTTEEALKELRRELSDRQSDMLSEAHRELAKVSDIPLQDIDDLSRTQLKIRLIQLSKELQDRTQWEAVRLKEFLAMQEKETTDRYMQLMKKQRMELEDTMEQRLKSQKKEMEEEMKDALYRKEQALQSIVDHALKLQEKEHQDEKANFEQQTAERIAFQFEQQYGQSLAQAKAEVAKKLAAKVQETDRLVKRIQNLESALKMSQEYQQGSVAAHQMSAAALALAERLESSEPAATELSALVATIRAAPNSVVESAVKLLPKSAQTSGVPSLSELQTRFEESIHTKARQAAMVPEGNVGLEGQLLGMLFATIKAVPGPDEAAPESSSPVTNAEYTLSRARRQIQLGHLDAAIQQLESLPADSQVLFTVKDWMDDAKKRVAVDKALKMIRVECALANASLAKA